MIGVRPVPVGCPLRTQVEAHVQAMRAFAGQLTPSLKALRERIDASDIDGDDTADLQALLSSLASPSGRAANDGRALELPASRSGDCVRISPHHAADPVAKLIAWSLGVATAVGRQFTMGLPRAVVTASAHPPPTARRADADFE